MKRDLKINYSVLDDIKDSITSYSESLEEIKTLTRKFNEELEEYESEAVDALNQKYNDFQEEFKQCEEELNDLRDLFSGYISDMTGYIQPNNRG